MLKKVVSGLKRVIYPVSQGTAIFGTVILVILVLIPIVDITMRRFFTSPLPGAYELSEFALGLMIFTTLAYCAVRGMHIVVDIATSRMPDHLKRILDIVIYFLSFSMMGLVSWQLIHRALMVKADHEISTILYIPTFPFVLMAGIGCILLALVFLTLSLEKLSEAVKQ